MLYKDKPLQIMNNFKYLGVLNLFRSGSSLVRKKNHQTEQT